MPPLPEHQHQQQTLAGKVAIVSGSSSGIGAAVARELAARGASVVLNYPHAGLRAEAEATLAGLPVPPLPTPTLASTHSGVGGGESTGEGTSEANNIKREAGEEEGTEEKRHIAVEADLSTTTGPAALVSAAAARHGGRVDILVNNAGAAVNRPLAEHTLADWDALVNLNGRGTFLLTQAVLPYLPKPASSAPPVVKLGGEEEAEEEAEAETQTRPEGGNNKRGGGGGRIVNIISVSARAAPPLQTLYAGTKGMVDSFTRVWAKELPPRYGCTVNAASPGPTDTAGFAAAGEAFLREVAGPVVAATPVAPRLARPEEIAYAVAFLCEERSGWVNGAHLVASGGLYVD